METYSGTANILIRAKSNYSSRMVFAQRTPYIRNDILEGFKNNLRGVEAFNYQNLKGI